MLMRISIIIILYFLNQPIYAQNCSDEEYIKYNSVNFNLSFVHKGFSSPQIVDPKTGKGECEVSSETYLYNKSIKPNQFILLKDGVIGIKEYGSNIIAISTFAGAHNGRLYFLKKHIINKNDYPQKYNLEEIKIENENNFFSSDMSTIFVCEQDKKKGGTHSTLEIIVHNLSKDRNETIVKRYKFSYEKMKFFLVSSLRRSPS